MRLLGVSSQERRGRMTDLFMICDECEGVYTITGDFTIEEGHIRRMSFIPVSECSKCTIIALKVGLV